MCTYVLRILSYNEEQISSDERADWNKDVCDRVLQYEHNLWVYKKEIKRRVCLLKWAKKYRDKLKSDINLYNQ